MYLKRESTRAQQLLLLVLLLATLNAGYLTWRYLWVHSDPSLVGSSLCSFTERIDCDKVLSTPQARAFFVPNALLGLGFQVGCLIWVWFGFRLTENNRKMVLKVLLGVLMLGAGFTVLFWYLLLQLPVFCVLCPVNHLLIYVSLGLTWWILKRQTAEGGAVDGRHLWRLFAGSVAAFFMLQLLWILVFDTSGWELAAVFGFG